MFVDTTDVNLAYDQVDHGSHRTYADLVNPAATRVSSPSCKAATFGWETACRPLRHPDRGLIDWA